jgi:predicted dehydrogenase
LTRIGLLGCGHWGANVLRDLLTLGARVVVADPDPSRRATAVDRGAEGAVARADEVPTCDGYIVVTPAPTHRAVVAEMLHRGAPVFVEKPPCTTLDDVAAIVAAGGDRLFVMHKWRYHPGIRALARLADSGHLGDQLVLETTRVGPESLPGDVDGVWHLGSHDLSIALEIFGALPPVAGADGSRDAAGRIVSCQVRMGDHERRHEMRLGAGAPVKTRSVALRGSGGVATLARPDAPSITVDTAAGRDEVALRDDLPLLEEMRAFLAHLDGGPAPRSSAADALLVAQRMTDIEDAIGTGTQ